MDQSTRDFNSISPSAELLIRLKAYTTIPFANKTNELLVKDLGPDFPLATAAGNPLFFKWLIHFENRYRSIDKILETITATNYLEMSSGYSCRGLTMCINQKIHFTDTDLPVLIEEKRKLIDVLLKDLEEQPKGILTLASLNVLDKDNFNRLADAFPTGPLIIINEGLLPYLNKEEKIKLCGIIREILQKRNGYWITGDIYTGDREDDADIPEMAKKWRDQHKIDENKFESFESASLFFAEQGFKIYKKESWVIDRLSCLEFIGEKKHSVIEKLRNKPADRETWCLKL